ncbi:MAG: protein translocase subunit SecF [candidate division Zixibacteria bacterium CG_4_9_14_3_um_filter_46_8]|nr:MAG: protein translocase subunit SecF [candidate division Zixibacteria bacterium CG_4_9_14_3_um_filter_46_8]
MLKIIGKTKIDFVGMRKIAFVFSSILVILGIVSMIAMLLGKGNMGIDFIGGVTMRGSFNNPVDVAKLRSIVSDAGFGEAQITEIHGENIPPNSILIRSKQVEAGSDSLLGDRLIQAVRRGMPEDEYILDSIDDIGPSVGESLQGKARWAVLLSVLGIMAYIWVRFDFRSGVAASIATFHDVLAIMGIFFLLQKEMNLLFVTALLTIAGYSLTDTVVVYDRIRENLRLFRKRASFAETINMSINEVLSRTIITSLTTLFVILALLLFGGMVIRDFALALFLGVVVGTYSSWFVASPIIVEWENRSPRRLK